MLFKVEYPLDAAPRVDAAGLGVEAAIRRSRRLGGARQTLKRAYVLEAEKSGAEATLCVQVTNAGAPFAACALPGGKQKPAQEGSA
jgi:hypothetical protein